MAVVRHGVSLPLTHLKVEVNAIHLVCQRPLRERGAVHSGITCKGDFCGASTRDEDDGRHGVAVREGSSTRCARPPPTERPSSSDVDGTERL